MISNVDMNRLENAEAIKVLLYDVHDLLRY